MINKQHNSKHLLHALRVVLFGVIRGIVDTAARLSRLTAIEPCGWLFTGMNPVMQSSVACIGNERRFYSDTPRG